MSLIGKKIEHFNANAYHNNNFIKVDSNDFLGKWTIMFFYPADFTFVCPTELSDLADFHSKFKELNAEIYSVSTDTHFVHKAWHDTSDAIKNINYPMIADPTGKISKSFDVYIEEEGLANRGTFIIDPNGVIQAIEITTDGIGRNAEELFRKFKAAKYINENPGQVCPAKWNDGAKTLTPSLDLVGKI